MTLRAVFAGLAVAACVPQSSPPPAADPAVVAAEIAAQFDTLSVAVIRHDWDQVEATFADGDDVTLAMDGVLTVGRSAIMAGFRADSSILAYLEYRWEDPRIRLLGANAAVHSTGFRERLAMRSGDTVAIQGTWTNAFQRIDGRWRIVHMAASHRPASP
ncbi:MAG TPA: nuclear transport factor 2 family protein [Gemmatimonadales bacterium]